MQNYLSLIKFAHTIFALPFALLGYFLAIKLPEYNFNAKTLILVILCMIFARSAAMAFNRYADRSIDAKNPRTSKREIPAGVISPNQAIYFVLLNVFAFIVCSYFINQLCFYLSPVALAVILGYSYTKRFTSFCHFVLGLGLALAPVGAFIAVTGHFYLIPIIYGGVVLFWVAGFDVIYALQDDEFDKDNSLRSIPSWLGKKKALKVSQIAHVLSAIMVIAGAVLLKEAYPNFSWLSGVAAVIFITLLIFQHRLVKADDLSKVNIAFFTTNGLASIIFCALIIADLYI